MVDTRAARAGLLVLTLINLFNYLDRWIVAALAESMKHSELRLSDAQLGSLMTGFLVVYTATAPLFGSLGDRRARPRLLGSAWRSGASPRPWRASRAASPRCSWPGPPWASERR